MNRTLKKLVSIMLAAVIIFSAAPLSGMVGIELPDLFSFTAKAAESGKCGDNLTWSFDKSTGVLTISGTGEMEDYQKYYDAPWYSYGEDIKSIVFPSRITSIGDYAFSYTAITDVSIPNKVTSIGNGAFFRCFELKNVAIPNSVTTIGNYTFEECDIANISIPNSVKTIGNSTFSHTPISNIIIPNSVTSIGDNAFYGCNNLNQITIPASVKNIGSDVFGWCSSLSYITVDPNNKYYSNDNKGVLFNKDKTNLISYPIGNNGAEYIVPNTVKAINEYAFMCCDNLSSVTFPNSVTSIGACAFFSCDNLAKINFSKSITSIGTSAFDLCSSLSDVYYSGTETEWKKINFAVQNDELITANIHYNSQYNPYNQYFDMKEDTWSFANSSLSFADGEKKYYIPVERYNEVFGKAYTKTHLIKSTWGGNCFGMCAAAAMLYLDKLNRNEYVANETNKYYNKIVSDPVFYTTAGYNTPVTKLIESYQILGCSSIDYVYGENSTYSKLYNDYFLPNSSNEFFEHNSKGTYISDCLNKIKNSNEPLIITINAGKTCHAILTRTDKKPLPLENGWFRVFVYDPNKPYVDEGISNDNELASWYCNSYLRTDDIYIEMNPQKNLFRYNCSNNSQDSSALCGSTYDDTVIYTQNKTDVGETKNPHFLVVTNVSGLPTKFNGKEPYKNKKTEIFIDDTQNFTVRNSKGEIVLTVKNGEWFHVYRTIDIFTFPSGSGNRFSKAQLPNEIYTIDYDSGVLDISTSNGTIVFSSDKPLTLRVDSKTNQIDITALENSNVDLKISNIENSDEFTLATIEGVLKKSSDLTVSLNDDNVFNAVTANKFNIIIESESNQETILLDENVTINLRERLQKYTHTTLKIQNNTGSRTISYGETLNLSVIATDKPADTTIFWYVDGVKKGEGETFNVNFESGTKTVEVKLIDTNGNVIKNANGNEIKDTEMVTVKAGFFQKLISFFKNLFGLNRIILQAIFKETT